MRHTGHRELTHLSDELVIGGVSETAVSASLTAKRWSAVLHLITRNASLHSVCARLQVYSCRCSLVNLTQTRCTGVHSKAVACNVAAEMECCRSGEGQ